MMTRNFGTRGLLSGGIGGVVSPGGVSLGSLEPHKTAMLFDDFIALAVAGNTAITSTLSGSGTATTNLPSGLSSVEQHPGIVTLGTGATATATSFLARGNNNGSGWRLGGGQVVIEWLVYIPTLSTGADEFQVIAGLGDTNGTLDQVDGVWLEYTRTTSVNWLMSTAANSVRTRTASSVAVAVGWNRLRAVVNAAGTSVEYFVSNAGGPLVSLGTVTTNIPTAAARSCSTLCGLIKTVGTTVRELGVDYMLAEQQFTNFRN